jgi:hypothetical protein
MHELKRLVVSKNLSSLTFGHSGSESFLGC